MKGRIKVITASMLPITFKLVVYSGKVKQNVVCPKTGIIPAGKRKELFLVFYMYKECKSYSIHKCP